MESCHSLPPRIKLPALGGLASSSSGPTSYSTIGHLVNIIEQLKNKDKIISHLERELGHQSGYALQLALEREAVQDPASTATPATTAMMANMDLSLSSGSSGKLGDGTGTKCNMFTVAGFEGEGTRAIEDLAHLETEIRDLQEKCSCVQQDNQELSKKLKDLEQKNKQLNEKNKKFLDKNVELTSLNRNLKDQTQLLTDDHKKLKEQHEHSKRKCQQLSRQLQQERCERSCMEEKVAQMATMTQHLTEQGKSIAALKQACSEKDRRIELIQHRKKRRRLMRSQEKCTGVKETFYGYDEDSRSVDSENSLSSVSFGTISDDDLWDELTREEVEKNYQRLMREHHELEKSYALLQSQTAGLLDPQREGKLRSQLEMDLFTSQCRIEELEKLLTEKGQGEACDWLREKEKLFTTNEVLCQQVQMYESENSKLQQELSDSREQVEDLEFQIVELEECHQVKTCECSQREVTAADSAGSMSGSVAHLEMDSLRKQLVVLLQGHGDQARSFLDKLDIFITRAREAEQKIQNLECTAKELQTKVISLQQEKTTLEEMLLSTQGVAPNINETVQKLTQKDQAIVHDKSEEELLDKNRKYQSRCEEAENQNTRLGKRVEDLEDELLKMRAKQHLKPVNRTDSEKEKMSRGNSVTMETPSKRDKNSQTYTKMLDKCVTTMALEYDVQPKQEDFDVLDQRFQNLFEENLSLKRKLGESKLLDEESEKSLDMSYDSRVADMEEYCEDLQERLQTAEMSDRQMREKLKLAEHTINDLEGSEGFFREKVDELTNRESEAKKQTLKLHQTVQELKEIVLDKDFVETALREKCDFLEKAELASAQIINELQNTEKSLRHQLELKSDIEGDAKFAEKLKAKINVLERDNKKLSVRVSELEEDEEVLRENWRRVADEDANRIECLEQKVKMLDALNRQLKNSLQDAQDIYIENVPQSSSLASELSESQRGNSELTLAKRSYSTPYLHSAGYEQSMPNQRSLSHRDLDMLTEAEGLEKIQELEEQLENVVEDKNTKIENLHEKIANLKENELKLSETLMEMEHEERELRAKLALYESSEVTVEKMLQYENKILELHSSQENLLDRLESLEDHEETLQEKLEKSEQEARIKVATLEKQLKNIHVQLEKAKLRGEELFKEKELLKNQIDKLENKIRLYVRKGEEAKEKITELNEKITVFEQREAYASEKVKDMEDNIDAIRQKEERSKTRIAQLENEVADLRQREEKARARLEVLKDEVREFEERDSESTERIQELEKHEKELMEKMSEYAKSHTLSKNKISELEGQITKYDSQIQSLETELSKAKNTEQAKRNTIENMEKTQVELTESLTKLRSSEDSYAQQLSFLDKKKSDQILELEQEREDLLSKVKKLEVSVREHVGSVRYLEQKLADSQGCERSTGEKLASLESTLAEYEQIILQKTNQVQELQKDKTEVTEQFQELTSQVEDLESDNRNLRDQVWNLQQEKGSLENLLGQQTSKEDGHQKVLESLRNSLNQLQDTNRENEGQIRKLSQDATSVEQRNKDLSSELSHVISLKDDLEKKVQTLTEELASFQKENEDLRTQVTSVVSEKDEIQSNLDSLTCDLDFVNGVVADLKFSVKSLESENSQLKTESEAVQTECYDLKQKLYASKSVDEETGKKTKLLSQSVDSLETTNRDLQRSVSSLEQERGELVRELEKTRCECESIKVKLNESCENEKNLRDKVMLSEDQQERLQERVNVLTDEIVQVKDSREVMQKQLSEEMEEKKVSLKERMEKLQKEHLHVSKKLEVLQDAESKLMDRIVELEEIEQSLRDQLQKSQDRTAKLEKTSAAGVTEMTVPSRPEVTDKSTSTSDLQSSEKNESGQKVSGIFQRVQELESENKDLTARLQDHENASSQLKQLKEKVQLLEEGEDKLMDRVMELEENEERLRSQVGKWKRSASLVEGNNEMGDLLRSEEELRMRVEELEEEKRELEEQVKEYQLRNWKVDENVDVADLIERVERLKEEKAGVEELLESEREKVDKIIKEKMILQEEVQCLNEQMDDEKHEFEKKIKTLERKHQKELFKIDSLQSSEIVLKKSLETVRQEKMKFENLLSDLENQVEEERKKDDGNRNGKQTAEGRGAGSTMLKSLSQEKAVIKDLETELRKTQDKLEEVQTDYENRISELHNQGKTLEENEKQLKSAINVHVQKEQELDGQIQSLHGEIAQMCDKSKVLEDKLSSLLQENSSLVQKCESLRSENEELSRSLKAFHQEGDQKKGATHHHVLPKISTSLMTSSQGPRSKDILKKPLPFGAIKTVQSLRDKDLQGHVLALEAKQNEYINKISTLEKENQELKSHSSRVKVVSQVLPTYASKQFGASKYSGAKETSNEDLLKAAHKLEQENQQNKEKMKEVENNLAAFRREVTGITEVIARKSEPSTSHHSHPEIRGLEMEIQMRLSAQKEKETALSSSLKKAEEVLRREKLEAAARIQVLQEQLALAKKTCRPDVTPGQSENLTKLKHQVIELQASEAKLKQKVVDLQLAEDDLRKRLTRSEKPVGLTRPASASKCDGNHAEFLFKLDNLQKSEDSLKRKIEKLEQDARDVQNRDLSRKVDQLEQAGKSLKKKVDHLESRKADPAPSQADAMLDKPEDILLQQIKDLEKLDKHHREQIADLEADRDELHEITRRDKATIHDQNVRIRELQLSEKVLRDQYDKLEQTEAELYRKCDDLENQVAKMEDKMHLLLVHERRLKELVKKLKLDEELWLAKSENMEMTVEELAASEANLKKRLEELVMEKMTLAQKSEYLHMRCQELENSETALFQKVKSYENVEVSLQNKLMVLENSEAAANSKISELDMMNMDISTRLQRAVEENAVLFNHIQNLQGSIQELDRQLLVVKDSELGLKQHVESLQKNESVLQKRVKEFELRDIDAQAKVRQLEQTEAIMKDRISTLQRNENKLKYRIQEIESLGTQSTESTPRDKLPRTIEECHKKIVVLQNQAALAAKFSDSEGATVKVPKAEFTNMQAKMVLLTATESQMSEVGRLNLHLKDTISQLRKGKASCGHEVELDVCRKRIDSYQNIVQRLREILPAEQVPSLLGPEPDSSGQSSSSEILPARGLQSMESERVMQTMRGLTGSKGSRSRPKTQHAEDPMPSDLSSADEEIVHQVQGSGVYTRPRVAPTASQESHRNGGHVESSDAESVVEEHWKKIESKKPRLDKTSELSSNWKSVAKAVPSNSPHRSKDKQEELMIGLTLQSESEQSHYRSQNDTDSNRSSPLLPRAGASRSDASRESPAPPLPKTLPPSLPQNAGSFAGESYYLPSSDLDNSAEESSQPQRFVTEHVIHPSSAPPSSAHAMYPVSSVDSVADSGQGTGSMVSTIRGSVIKDRIAQLQRQLESKSSGAESRTDDESVFSWKHRAHEKPLNIEIIEKESKPLKDEINKLEREVEEKTRYIGTLEIWLSNAEDMLRNKNKYSDRDIIQNLQSEIVRVRSELQNSGYRKDDISRDPAALKSELDKRDREIVAKTREIDTLMGEIRHWQDECQGIEDMRANALDSLRGLEVEITHLQDADKQLQELREEYNQLRGQYEEMERLKNKALTSVAPLRAQITRLTHKCQQKDEMIRRLADELKSCQSAENLSSLLEELDQIEMDLQNEEYYRPLSPMTPPSLESPRTGKIDVNSFIRNQRNSGRWSSSSSLSDSRELFSDLEPGSVATKKRPKSADHLTGRRSPFQGILKRSINANNLSPRGGEVGLVDRMREKYGNLPDALHFVAIADYNPDVFSSSRQPRSSHSHQLDL